MRTPESQRLRRGSATRRREAGEQAKAPLGHVTRAVRHRRVAAIIVPYRTVRAVLYCAVCAPWDKGRVVVDESRYRD